jgi:hypothetical protein
MIEPQAFAQGVCPNCGHDWTAHNAYIARQEKTCEESLPDGYNIRVSYTD